MLVNTLSESFVFHEARQTAITHRGRPIPVSPSSQMAATDRDRSIALSHDRDGAEAAWRG